jgi:hypothetical protein
MLVVGLLVCSCVAALADDVSAPDKSKFNLFKPTPVELLRPLRMQAYDNVEDPTTVDAGHFQVEGSLIDYFTSDRQRELTLVPSNPLLLGQTAKSDISQTAYSWRPRFTAGLLNNLDLEVMPTYSVRSTHIETSFPFSSEHISQKFNSSGFGPVIVESKLNLWGNDNGRTALSLSPALSIPTDRGNVLFGFQGAFALRLPQDFYVKLESGVFQERFAGNNYAEFFEGLSLNKSICSRLDGYVSLTATVSTDPATDWFGYVGFGAIYKVTRDFQLFGGLNIGLTDSSFDYNPRAGMAWRL